MIYLLSSLAPVADGWPDALCWKMKFSLPFIAITLGYLAGCGFLSIFAVIHGNQILQFRTEMIWAGIYGFPLGFLGFVVPFRLISSDHRFWRFYISPIAGGVLGWLSLAILLSELAFSVPFGGFAAVMGFVTFFVGSVFNRLYLHSSPAEASSCTTSQRTPTRYTHGVD